MECSKSEQMSRTVGVVGQNDLPGVPTLGNMMGDVNHDNAGEAGHGLKASERTGAGTKAEWKVLVENYGVPTSGENNSASPVCPRISPPHFPRAESGVQWTVQLVRKRRNAAKWLT